MNFARIFGKSDDKAEARKTLRNLVDRQSRPNLKALDVLAQRVDILSLSVKFFGYELARTLAEACPAVAIFPCSRSNWGARLQPRRTSRPTGWGIGCGQLQIGRIYHRKVWELAYVLQAIHMHGSMRAGARGL